MRVGKPNVFKYSDERSDSLILRHFDLPLDSSSIVTVETCCMCGSLLWSDSEAAPNCGVLEVAGSVELFEFVCRSSPAQSIVCKACQATVWLLHCHAEGRCKDHVRDSMEHNKALRDQCERSRAQVSPANTTTVHAQSHECIAHAHLSSDVTEGWLVNDNRVGWAFIRTVKLTGIIASPDASQRGKRAPC